MVVSGGCEAAERRQAYTYLKYYLESVLQLLLKFGCGGETKKKTKQLAKQVTQWRRALQTIMVKKKRETNCDAKWWLYIVGFGCAITITKLRMRKLLPSI